MRGGPRFTALGTLVALGGMLAASACASSEPPKTNLAFLDSVAHMAAANLLRGVALPPGRAVRISTPVSGDTMGLFAQRVVEQLRAAGAEVRLATPPLGSGVSPGMGDAPPGVGADSTDLDLRLQVSGAGVSYVGTDRKFLLGVRGYDRMASMRVGASLVDLRTKDVLWANSVSALAEDRVSKGDLAYVQSGSGALVPPVPRGSGTRLLEPLIVVAIVTGLVVLFYSNRN